MHARRCVIITEVRINKSVTRDLLPKAMELGVARQSEKGLCCGPEMFDYLNIRSRLWCAITYQDSSAEMRIRQFQRLRLLVHGNTAVHGYARSICFYLINKSKGQKHIYIYFYCNMTCINVACFGVIGRTLFGERWNVSFASPFCLHFFRSNYFRIYLHICASWLVSACVKPYSSIRPQVSTRLSL